MRSCRIYHCIHDGNILQFFSNCITILLSAILQPTISQSLCFTKQIWSISLIWSVIMNSIVNSNWWSLMVSSLRKNWKVICLLCEWSIYDLIISSHWWIQRVIYPCLLPKVSKNVWSLDFSTLLILILFIILVFLC